MRIWGKNKTRVSNSRTAARALRKNEKKNRKKKKRKKRTPLHLNRYISKCCRTLVQEKTNRAVYYNTHVFYYNILYHVYVLAYCLTRRVNKSV